MLEYGYPVLFALGLWWFSTGVVLYLDNLPGRTFGWTMLGGTAVLAFAVFALGRQQYLHLPECGLHRLHLRRDGLGCLGDELFHRTLDRAAQDTHARQVVRLEALRSRHPDQPLS
jgi:hypothetical protein